MEAERYILVDGLRLGVYPKTLFKARSIMSLCKHVKERIPRKLKGTQKLIATASGSPQWLCDVGAIFAWATSMVGVSLRQRDHRLMGFSNLIAAIIQAEKSKLLIQRKLTRGIYRRKVFFTPGAEVIQSKAALTFVACFDDLKDGFVGNDGMVNNGKTKRQSLPKKFGQEVFFRKVEVFKWNGIPNEEIKFVDTAKTLRLVLERIRDRKTSLRSAWETTFQTCRDISTLPSFNDGKRGVFESLAEGKMRVLQGTNSNGRINEYLADPSFGFSKIVNCENIFNFILSESDSFDALVDNPPWDKWFLNIYFRFIRYMEKPCVIILPKGATELESFLNVFGRCTMRTIISRGTVGEKKRREREKLKRKLKRSPRTLRKKKVKQLA